jgi:hypothetical protein
LPQMIVFAVDWPSLAVGLVIAMAGLLLIARSWTIRRYLLKPQDGDAWFSILDKCMLTERRPWLAVFFVASVGLVFTIGGAVAVVAVLNSDGH